MPIEVHFTINDPRKILYLRVYSNTDKQNVPELLHAEIVPVNSPEQAWKFQRLIGEACVKLRNFGPGHFAMIATGDNDRDADMHLLCKVTYV